MSNKELSLKQNIIWNSAGSLVYLALQWLMSYSVTKVLGFENAGIFSLCLSVGNVVLAASLYGVRNYQVSDVKKLFSDKIYVVARYFSCALGIVGAVTFLLIRSYSSYTMMCIFAFVLYKISEAYVDVYHGIIQRNMRMDIIGKSFVLRGISTTALFFVCMFFTKELFWSIVVLFISSFILIFIYDHRRVDDFYDKNSTFSRKDTMRLLVVCFPLAIFSFLTNLVASVPRIFLESIMGEEQLGIYASVAIPAVIIQVLANFVFAPMATVFAKQIEDKDFSALYKLFLKTVMYIVVLSGLVMVGGYFLAEWGLVLLFGEPIRAYAYLFMPILFVSFFTALSWLLALILTVIRDFKGMIISTACALVLCLSGSAASIRHYGLNGASFILIACLIVQIIGMILFMYFKIRKMKRQ